LIIILDQTIASLIVNFAWLLTAHVSSKLPPSMNFMRINQFLQFQSCNCNKSLIPPLSNGNGLNIVIGLRFIKVMTIPSNLHTKVAGIGDMFGIRVF